MGFLGFLGDALGVFGSLVGSIFGTNKTNASVDRTNASNLRINQMNNEFAANEAEKARNYTTQMWYNQNEYNSPDAQMKRRAAAGLNPYMDIENGNAGSVSTSMASPSSSAVMQPKNWNSIGDSISNAIQLGQMVRESNAQIQQLQGSKAVSDAQALQIMSNTDWGKLTPEYKKALRDTGLMRFNLGFDTDKAQLDNIRWMSKLYDAERTGMLLDNDAKRIVNKYLDKGQQLQLDIEAQRLANMVMEGKLTKEQMLNTIADTIRIKASSAGQRIANHLARSTASSYIEAMNAQYSNDSEYYKGLLPYSGSFGQYEYKERQSSSGMSSFNFENRFWDRWIRNAGLIGNGIGAVGRTAASFRSTRK